MIGQFKKYLWVLVTLADWLCGVYFSFYKNTSNNLQIMCCKDDFSFLFFPWFFINFK